MSASQLGNCPRCGKLYLRYREICDQCNEKEEEDYRMVADYLYENPGITISELSRATNVSIGQIRQFILSGRLLTGHFPNLEYPCDTCGTMIRTGKKCSKCLEAIERLSTAVSDSNETENSKKNGTAGGYISKYL